MMRSILLIFAFLTSKLISHEPVGLFLYPQSALRHWHYNKLLKPEKRKPAKTAILIIMAPKMDDSYTECRWRLGKKVWEQYMNSNSNVDCYFVQPTLPRAGYSEQVWREGNTIYVGDRLYKDYGISRILYKTIMAINYLLPNYTHFIRTNINTFFDLNAVNEYMETHHQSMYTAPLWENAWYTIGYGILFTADVAAHIAEEYRRLEGMEIVSHHHADDAILTSLATGIWPYDSAQHVFRCCSTLPFGVRQLMCKESLSTKRLSQYGALLIPPISLEEALKYCQQAPNTVMLYRIRGGFDLDQLTMLYEYLLDKIYPTLPRINLVEYARSLPTVQEPKN